MPARGPHDDREQAEAALREAFARFNREQDVAKARELIADDAEHVTRDGTLRGSDHWASEIGEQLKHWRLETIIEEVVDAGGGALVLFTDVRRFEPGGDKVAWEAWPAMVVRVHEGKVVFIEGYVDRRAALSDLGVEQD